MTKINQIEGSSGVPGFVFRGGMVKKLFREHKVTKAIVAELTKPISWPGIAKGLKWDKGSVVIVAMDPKGSDGQQMGTPGSGGVIVGGKMQGIQKTEFKKIRDYDVNESAIMEAGTRGFAIVKADFGTLAKLGKALKADKSVVSVKRRGDDGYNVSMNATGEEEGRKHLMGIVNRVAGAAKTKKNRTRIDGGSVEESTIQGYDGIAEDVAICILQDAVSDTLGSSLMAHQSFVTEFDNLTRDGYYESAIRRVETFAGELEEAQAELLAAASTTALAQVREGRVHEHIDDNRAARQGRIAEHRAEIEKMAAKNGSQESVEDEEDETLVEWDEDSDLDQVAENLDRELRMIAGMIEKGYATIILSEDEEHRTLFGRDDDHAEEVVLEMGWDLDDVKIVEADDYGTELTEMAAAVKLSGEIVKWIKLHNKAAKTKGGPPVSSAELRNTFHIRPHEADDIIDGLYPKYKDNPAMLRREIANTLQPATQHAVHAMNGVKAMHASEEGDDAEDLTEGKKKRDDLDPVYKGQTGAIKDAGFTEAQMAALESAGIDLEELNTAFEAQADDVDEDEDDDGAAEGDDKTTHGKSDDKKRRVTSPKKHDESEEVTDADGLVEVTVPQAQAQMLVDACKAVGLGSDTDIAIHDGQCVVRVAEDMAEQMQEHLSAAVIAG